MGNRWDGVEELLVGCAEDDLQRTGEVAPALVAFTGEQVQFVAWLRPFDKGAYQAPVIELLALALPLRADRLAMSFAGRAWSLDDPVPPVSGEADLRQRVLVLHLVDGSGGEVLARSVLRAFDLEGRSVRWQEPRRTEPGEGWLPRALEVAADRRHGLRAGLEDIRAQAVRLVALGHELYVSPALRVRLEAATARGR